MMKPYTTPITKEEIEKIAQATIAEALKTSFFNELMDDSRQIRLSVNIILANLPYEIGKARTISSRCSALADASIDFIGKSYSKDAKRELTRLKQGVCSDIKLVLYRRYIEKIIKQFTTDYLTNNPGNWNLRAFLNWSDLNGDNIGLRFFNFWKSNIEKHGDHYFKKHFVIHLQEDHQENYRPIFTFPDWKAMSDSDLAEALTSLEMKHKPSDRTWSITSIRSWVDHEASSTGGSFYRFWRKHVEKEGDSLFLQRILPHLPEEWQKMYVGDRLRGGRALRNWKSMDDTEIADALKSLQDYTPRAWYLGSLISWWGEEGEYIGNSFYDYWRKHVEKEGDSLFRQRILPHLPEEWQNNYGDKRQRCPYEWCSMEDSAIAVLLKDLKKQSNPAKKRWGLGSIAYWKVSENECWGRFFYTFWRKHVEKEGDKLFKQRILPHFPEEWQRNYKTL